MAIELFMPKMSDNMKMGEIIEWLVKEGDEVEKGQPVLMVMTDKAAVEVETSASGVLKGIRTGAEAGASVAVGETIAFIAKPDEEVPVLPPLLHAGNQEPKETTIAIDATHKLVKSDTDHPRGAPAVRRLARELGVDLKMVKGSGPEGRILERDIRSYIKTDEIESTIRDKGLPCSPLARRLAKKLDVDLKDVTGSGPNGRITKEDVLAHEQSRAMDTIQTPSTAQSVEGAFEWIDLTRIQRLTGQRMAESVRTIPQFSLTISVDATSILQYRESLMDRFVTATGERLSITAILVKIVASAIREMPRVNATFEAERVKIQKQINIGVAMGSEKGLIVPVIKNADGKSLVEIVKELATFHEKTRRMLFGIEDLSGGTFTISNLGMYGIDRFNAIINPPESAILAVGRIVKTPIGMSDDTIALRPLLNLTLSIDHRSMDGIQGAAFLSKLKELIEKPLFPLMEEIRRS